MIGPRFGMCFIALAATATLAVAQGLPAAGVDEILAGTRSCIAATSETALDQQRLKADGWRQGSMSSKARPVADAPIIYGKGGLLMMIPRGQAATPLCMFSASIMSFREFPKLQAAMASAYGKPASDDGKGEQMFLTADNHLVDIASTGSKERPSVRVAVGPVPQEKK